ncbi:MAG: RloB domain-containing protein, partial [Bacteroidales bacterium]|nr:RloB domain-containing protein [Bacteroidales bacterium]
KRRRRLIGQRAPELGYYIIITDTKETEKNYFKGLRRSIPSHLQRKLVVKTKRVDMGNFVDVALEEKNKNPNYAQPWIVFDRDQVPNFDQIIERAEKKGIRVGWTNPCIEIWFFGHFGEMPMFKESRQCFDKFKEVFKSKFNHEYNKADPQIYEKLKEKGDLKQAISIAESRYRQYMRDQPQNPASAMISCGTIHQLVEEINNKI